MASLAGKAEAGEMRELTVRAVILGGIITLVFTAANVYLGLKVGLTFATSIPAGPSSLTSCSAQTRSPSATGRAPR